MNIPLRFVFTAGLGAAGMYYFDPARGRRRRAQLRERLGQGERRTSRTADSAPSPRPRAPQEHTEFMREVWSPEVRAIGGVAGSTAALYGLGRGGLRGMLLGIAGVLLLARAVTNVELRRLPGIARHAGDTGAGRRAGVSDVENGTLPRRENTPENQPGPVH